MTQSNLGIFRVGCKAPEIEFFLMPEFRFMNDPAKLTWYLHQDEDLFEGLALAIWIPKGDISQRGWNEGDNPVEDFIWKVENKGSWRQSRHDWQTVWGIYRNEVQSGAVLVQEPDGPESGNGMQVNRLADRVKLDGKCFSGSVDIGALRNGWTTNRQGKDMTTMAIV